jgi:hypothetical protein
MKTTIKTIVTVAFMLSVSSIYAQSETQVVRSRSNIKTQRTADGDPIKVGDVKLGKGTIIETDEGWFFENVKLNAEQRTALLNIGRLPGPLGGLASKSQSTDELLESGNFIISKKGMKPNELKAMAQLKADYDIKRMVK